MIFSIPSLGPPHLVLSIQVIEPSAVLLPFSRSRWLNLQYSSQLNPLLEKVQSNRAE